jgi:hypothetical protein
MAKKKKDDSYLALRLDGKVYVVDKQKGKRAKATEIDGELVLKVLIAALTAGVYIVLDEHEKTGKMPNDGPLKTLASKPRRYSGTLR